MKNNYFKEQPGTRLLDLWAVNYPWVAKAVGIAPQVGTDPATAALRIRATRSLWDPTYVDESWIGENMRVLPLLRDWIAKYHPGLGISIGEWNFGAEAHMSRGFVNTAQPGPCGHHGRPPA